MNIQLMIKSNLEFTSLAFSINIRSSELSNGSETHVLLSAATRVLVKHDKLFGFRV